MVICEDCKSHRRLYPSIPIELPQLKKNDVTVYIDRRDWMLSGIERYGVVYVQYIPPPIRQLMTNLFIKVGEKYYTSDNTYDTGEQEDRLFQFESRSIPLVVRTRKKI